MYQIPIDHHLSTKRDSYNELKITTTQQRHHLQSYNALTLQRTPGRDLQQLGISARQLRVQPFSAVQSAIFQRRDCTTALPTERGSSTIHKRPRRSATLLPLATLPPFASYAPPIAHFTTPRIFVCPRHMRSSFSMSTTAYPGRRRRSVPGTELHHTAPPTLASVQEHRTCGGPG